MRLSDIQIVGKRSALPTQREVDDLVVRIGSPLPRGYAEYILALGEGNLAGYVRVYPPWRIANELQQWRDRIREYWFWSEITQEHALECIIIGDTCDGDELIVHPSHPDDVLVLPRDSTKAMKAGCGLWEAVDWLCSSGVLTARIRSRRFEPFDSRASRR